MAFYPPQKTTVPLYTWENDRNVPGFGMKRIAANQAARRSEDRIRRTHTRAGVKTGAILDPDDE